MISEKTILLYIVYIHIHTKKEHINQAVAS